MVGPFPTHPLARGSVLLVIPIICIACFPSFLFPRSSVFHPVLTGAENLNELLLLTVQSVCNTQGIRIPWAEVAKTMGNNVSEGAIVQHLAKLRVRRVAANKEVPPPLRRGGSGVAPKAPATASNTSDAASGPSTETSDKKSLKTKKKDTSSSDEGDSANSAVSSDTSSDEEYGKKRRAKKAKKARKKKKAKREDIDIKSEPGTDEEAEEDQGMERAADDRGDELVAIGAQFLSYPNDKKLPSSSPASSERSLEPKKPTKIVTLRIRQGLENFVEPSVSGGQNGETVVPSYPNANRGNHYAAVAPANLQTPNGLLGFRGFDNVLQGNQTMGAAIGYGYGDLPQPSPVQGQGRTTVYQPLQGIPLNPYADLHSTDDAHLLEPPALFNPMHLSSPDHALIEHPLFPDESAYSDMMWMDSIEAPDMVH